MSKKSPKSARQSPRSNDIDITSSSKSKQKKKRNKRRIFANIFGSIILGISAIAIAAILSLSLRPFAQSGDLEAMEDILGSSNKNVAYILVCGVDESEALTDVMMIICYDIKNQTANILQFPRDIYTGPDVPTGKTGKLNAVYGQAPKGTSKIGSLMSYYNNYFGIPIDHYMLLNIKALRTVVDILGGVDITLEKKLTLENFRTGKRTIKLPAGTVTLDGNLAESFMRERKSYVEGDVGRMRAQRSFYIGLAKKVKSMSTSQMVSLATKCYDEIQTDMNLGQMLGYARKAKNIDLEKIGIHSVPGSSGTYRIAGAGKRSFFSVDLNYYIDLVYEYMNPYDSIIYEKIQPYQIHSGKPNSVVEGQTFD